MARVGIVYFKDSDNIGDDVQSLAMEVLVARVAPETEVVWVDREAMDDPQYATLNGLICNGWFMYHPSHWPPATSNVLFTSFHVTTRNASSQQLIHPELTAYYNAQFGGVGCRDYSTLRRFQSIGVNAYFSSCATLTLRPTPGIQKNHSILVVDPFYHVTEDWDFQNWLLNRMVPSEEQHRLIRWSNTEISMPSLSIEERRARARKYLDQIAAADVVITSRIHAALPAIAMGVPVYFTLAGYDRGAHSLDRFEGVIDLFDVLEGHLFPFSSRRKWGKIQRLLHAHRWIPTSAFPIALDLHPRGLSTQTASEVARRAGGIESKVRDYLKSLP
jgi:hypothetical protein